MSTSFADLGLNASLADTVRDRGYTTPTSIQEALIPSMLDGRDVVGQAQTGMGKTAAFALPMLHAFGEGTGTLRGIVLTPTRELAKQVAEAVYAYGNRLDFRVLPIYGGQPYQRQIRRLKKGVDVVVGTPGRMLDLIRKGALDLSTVEVAVLDEADEMLSMGFIDDIKAILAATPDERQTAFFSATMSNDFQRLAKQQLNDPASCRLEPKERTVSSIEQRYYPVAKKRDRTPALMRLLETEDITSAIVFARTRNDTFRLADTLQSNGYSAGALNGEMDQPERQRMLDRFRNGDITILVGTNVAARGLDIDHVSHVFNYNLPRDPQVYVHRVGRTGRAGRSGTALTLVTPNRRKRLKQTERHIKRTIARTDVPSDAQVQAHRDATLRAEVATWMASNDYSRERDIIASLVEDGHDPLDVAAAALHVARTQRAEKRSESPKKTDRPAASHEDGMVRLRLNTGKRNNTRPGQVVGTLASATKMPGSAIGRIDIHPRYTTVDVPSEYADQVRAKSGSYKIGRQRVRVE